MVPKTLVFAKDDSHAEDIVKIIKEELGKGNEFFKKITYRTTGEKPEDLIASFRNSTNPRIAVSVDMIAAGTDIKPLECILFLRDVKSKLYFDQMKGRGTRIISTDDLQGVTSDAKTKDHFVIVDAVGVCEHAMSDTHSLTRKKGVSFEQLMQTIAEGRADEDTLETFAGRLATLDKKLDDKAKKEIEQVSEGKSLTNLINRLLDGIDTDKQIKRAKEKFKTEKPTQEQLEETIKESIDFACEPFKPRLRDTILEVKKRNEQIIDTGALDSLISSEFDEKAKEQRKKVVENFKDFIEKNKDEILALQIIYSKPYKMREITYNDIKKIAEAIENTPYNLTPEIIWHAYESLDKPKIHLLLGNRFTQKKGAAHAFKALSNEATKKMYNEFLDNKKCFRDHSTQINSQDDFEREFTVELRDFNSAGVAVFVNVVVAFFSFFKPPFSSDLILDPG